MKRIIITVVISLIIFGGSGYWIGYSTGNSAIKPVSYAEVVNFVKNNKVYDKLDSNEAFDSASTIKENANKKGIKCAFVILTIGSKFWAIDAFETTDKGVVYLDSQGTCFLEGIRVGGNELVSVIPAEITQGKEVRMNFSFGKNNINRIDYIW